MASASRPWLRTRSAPLRRWVNDPLETVTVSVLDTAIDGEGYRGVGPARAPATVLQDHLQPMVGGQWSVVAEVECSPDRGETWAPGADATLKGAAKVRVSLTGPVTAASLTIGVGTLAEGTGDASFDAVDITLEGGLDLSDITSADDPVATVSVEGPNNDLSAEGDVTEEISFSAEPVPGVEPTPGPNEEPGDGEGTSTPKPGCSTFCTVESLHLAEAHASPTGIRPRRVSNVLSHWRTTWRTVAER